MFKYKLFYPFALLLLITMLSCEKDNIDTVSTEIDDVEVENITAVNTLFARANPDETNSEASSLEFDCFSIETPFQVIGADSMINDVIDAETFFMMLEDQNLQIVDFVYPLNITSQDGEQIVVENGEELSRVFASCVPDQGWSEDLFPAFLLEDVSDCLVLIYPLTVIDERGEEKTVDNEEDLIKIISEQYVFFTFPLDVVTQDGNVESIADSANLFDMLLSCQDFGWDQDTIGFDGGDFDYIGCYKLTFPILAELTNGDQVVVNNHDEYCSLLLSGSFLDFAYPLTLTDEDGNTVTVENSEALDTLIDGCYYDGGGQYNDDLFALINGSIGSDSIGLCYTVNYPISAQVVDEDGNIESFTFSSGEEVLALDRYDLVLVYPVSVMVLANNNASQVIDDQSALYDLLSSCNTPSFSEEIFIFYFSSDYNPESCYSIKYPVTLTYADYFGETETITINSINDFDIYSAIELEFEYPLTLIWNETQEEVVLSSFEDFEDFYETCN